MLSRGGEGGRGLILALFSGDELLIIKGRGIIRGGRSICSGFCGML